MAKATHLLLHISMVELETKPSLSVKRSDHIRSIRYNVPVKFVAAYSTIDHFHILAFTLQPFPAPSTIKTCWRESLWSKTSWVLSIVLNPVVKLMQKFIRLIWTLNFKLMVFTYLCVIYTFTDCICACFVLKTGQKKKLQILYLAFCCLLLIY